MTRQIGVVTTSRADFGIYLPLLKEISDSAQLEPCIVASGSHLVDRFGRTEEEIKAAGYEIHQRIPCMLDGIGQTIGAASSGMAEILRQWQPDLMLVLGDRFEMLGCALGTFGSGVPLAHIHGGELTEGALDDSFRHALTKLSHIHFAPTPEAATRIEQLGEEPSRIFLSGSPAVDRLLFLRPEAVKTPEAFLLVTYHPVTQEPGQELAQIETLIAALEKTDIPCIVTAPNADPGREIIEEKLMDFCNRSRDSHYYVSVGAQVYVGLMQAATAMVGNSSSGLIEAPSFQLPVVNVGSRQRGRTRAANVIDCDILEHEIGAAINRAFDPHFRSSLIDLKNPYGDGSASRKIVSVLEGLELSDGLMCKQFCNLQPHST